MTLYELTRYWKQRAKELYDEAEGESTYASCSLSGEASGLIQAAKDLEDFCVSRSFSCTKGDTMNPNDLKATLLSESSTEQQREFAKMLAEQCAEANIQAKGHRCWTFIPSPTEYAKMAKYNQPPNYDKCPKCGGRLILEFYHGNIGETVNIVCLSNRNVKNSCDFKEYISDDD